MDLTPYYQGSYRRLFQQVNPSLAGMPERVEAQEIETMEQATATIVKNMGDKIEKMDEITNKGNLYSSENRALELIGDYQKKVAENPLVFDKHAKWADETANKIRGINMDFTNDEYRSHFETWKEREAKQFMIRSSRDIFQARTQAGKQSWEARIDGQLKRGDYEGAAATKRSGGGTFEPAEAAEEGAKTIDLMANLNRLKEASFSDPLGMKKNLDDPEFRDGLDWGVLFDLQAFNSRDVRRFQEEVRGGYQALLNEGKLVDVNKLDEDVKVGAVDVDYALQLKGALLRRDKAIKEGRAEGLRYVTDKDANDVIEENIFSYKPDEDVGNQVYSRIEGMIGTAQLSDGVRNHFKQMLNDRLNGKLDDGQAGVKNRAKAWIVDMHNQNRFTEWRIDKNSTSLDELKIDSKLFDESGRIKNLAMRYVEDSFKSNPNKSFEDLQKEVMGVVANAKKANPARVNYGSPVESLRVDVGNDVPVAVDGSNVLGSLPPEAPEDQKVVDAMPIADQDGISRADAGLLPEKDGGDALGRAKKWVMDNNFKGFSSSQAVLMFRNSCDLSGLSATDISTIEKIMIKNKLDLDNK
ncbi:MAG: hypothetical protein RR719_08510 [Akkermansia sp.]